MTTLHATRMSSRILLTASLVLSVSAPVLAQGKKGQAPKAKAKDKATPTRTVARWAPRWKVGDWWEIRTYKKENEATRIPLMKDTVSQPLKGLTAYRKGIPVGYFAANRFRMLVDRREVVTYAEKGSPSESFLVLEVRSLEGVPVQTAELWYSELDMTLAKVVLDPRGRHRRTFNLRGVAQLDVRGSGILGLPLDWPDLRPTTKKRWTLSLSRRRGKVEQRVRVSKKQKHVRVRLARVSKQGKQVGAATKLTFVQGIPFWSSLVTPTLRATLIKHGHRGKRR